MSSAGHDLGSRRWPDLEGGPPPVLALPVGSCEQHGPHLPLDTDTRLATALASRLATQRAEVLVAPPLTVTASGEHAGFPGTLSIGTEVLTSLVVELVRSADWSAGVVVVNGHGGNARALRQAAEVLQGEARQVLVWWPSAGADPADTHAGRMETSLLLALCPELVGDDRTPGSLQPLSELWPQLRTHGVRHVSPSGVLGDPSLASAEQGEALLQFLVHDLVEAYDGWRHRS